MPDIVIDSAKCTSCERCVAICPCCLYFTNGTSGNVAVRESSTARCVRCGHCIATCPTDAITCFEMDASSVEKIDKNVMPSRQSADLLLKTRRSIRNYKDRPIPREEIESILRVAAYAPTGKNSQTIQWAVVNDATRVRALAAIVVDWMRNMIECKHPLAEAFNFVGVIHAWEKGFDGILRGAPHLVMAHGPKSDSFGSSSAPLCLEYVDLAAHAHGYGACWAGFFDIAAKVWPPLVKALDLPNGNVLHGTLMLGIPAETYVGIPPRKKPEITWL